MEHPPPRKIPDLIEDYTKVVRSLANRPPAPQSPILHVTLENIQMRMRDGVKSVASLENSEHEHSCDSAAIFRVLYDLHLQARYILLQDQIKRAEEYANFRHIEHYNQLMAIETHSAGFQASILTDPNWIERRARIIADYNTHKAAFEFTTKGTIKVRKHWYVGQLDRLVADLKNAGDSTIEGEYAIAHRVFSAYVHSSSFALLLTTFPEHFLLLYSVKIFMRVVGGAAKYNKIEFDGFETAVYEDSLQPLF